MHKQYFTMLINCPKTIIKLEHNDTTKETFKQGMKSSHPRVLHGNNKFHTSKNKDTLFQ